MTIYLLKKTHSVTGLNYLCKTTQNPLKYRGSGKYWKLHLQKHGNDHITEILKECSTNDEVKHWGLYYSNLWDVVESDEWANLKPEDGDGGSAKGHSKSKSSVEKRSGDFHPRRKNPDKWDAGMASLKGRDSWWATGENSSMNNPLTIEKISASQSKFLKENPDKHPSKNPKVLEKWRENRKGANHPRHDSTVYSFMNKKSGEIVKMTRHEFYEKFDLKNQMGNLSEMIAGRRKSVKGWVLQG